MTVAYVSCSNGTGCKYWPASRRLKAARVEQGALDGPYGICEVRPLLIRIDVAAHPSDHEVRATMLHEMVHAMLGSRELGHGPRFWAQLEYLLARRAPITVRLPELGERGTLLCVIPRRFPLCRRLFRSAHLRNQRALSIGVQNGELKDFKLSPSDLEREAEDAALSGVPWRNFWTYTGRELGSFDLDGRTRPSVRRWEESARRGHRRGRRQRLQPFNAERVR